MAIDFPDSPSVDEIYSVGDKSWLWNGTYWEVQGSPTSTFSASDTAPSSPNAGDIWYRSDTSQTLIYYDSTWVEVGHSANIANFLADADADTKIQLEESSDEDTIRFDIAGSEKMTLNSSSLTVFDSLSVGSGASAGSFYASSTGANMLPSGTTAQRPASPTDGMIRYNSELNQLESHLDGSWSIVKKAFSATGGTITTSGGYTIHTFTTSGSFEVLSGSTEVEYVVVAGGGGTDDGAGSIGGSGGGGGGGYRSSVVGESSGGGASAESKLFVTAQTYTVTVGAGGTGFAQGNDSVFGSITSIGGGGGDQTSSSGKDGGSGGGQGISSNNPTGAAGSGTTGQGYAGGSASTANSGTTGGGGGAGQAGQTGNGGNGVQSSIDGTATYRAGGGAGESVNGTTYTGGLGGGGDTATNGTANTGGGAGGHAPNDSPGYNGGSGIVIIRYLT